MSKPWVHSFTALDLYELCPRKFQHEKILKDIPFVETEATRWGNEVHKALELAVKQGKPLEDRYAMFQPIFNSVVRVEGVKYAELKLGVNRNLDACDFFDSECYVRGIGDIVIDCGAKLFAGDYKTGKKKAGSKQLELMALLLFARFPEAQEIFTAFIWLQGKTLTSAVYRRDQIEELWDHFLHSMKTLEWAIENNMFHPRENFLCRNYCEIYDCLFNGRRKS